MGNKLMDRTDFQAMGATPASEWRKARQEGVPVELPGGRVVVIRPVNMSTFLRLGTIPDTLTPLVEKFVVNGGGSDALNTLTTDEALHLVDIYDAFAMTCLLYPRMVDDPKADDEIGRDDMSDQEKQFLFSLMGLPSAALANFRPQQTSAVDGVGGGTGNSPVTE
jgi:hypothetical protein